MRSLEKRIEVEIERYKIYISLVIVLTGGNYVLMIDLFWHPMNKILLVIGVIFLIFFVFAAIYSYIYTIKLLKKLKEKEENYV